MLSAQDGHSGEGDTTGLEREEGRIGPFSSLGSLSTWATP